MCGHHGRDFGVWATSVSVCVDPGTLDTFGHVYPDQTVPPSLEVNAHPEAWSSGTILEQYDPGAQPHLVWRESLYWGWTCDVSVEKLWGRKIWQTTCTRKAEAVRQKERCGAEEERGRREGKKMDGWKRWTDRWKTERIPATVCFPALTLCFSPDTFLFLILQDTPASLIPTHRFLLELAWSGLYCIEPQASN